MTSYSWNCPSCNGNARITESEVSANNHFCFLDVNSDWGRVLNSYFVRCPNPACNKYMLTVKLSSALKIDGKKLIRDEIRTWQLLPEGGSVKSFPEYIPEQIRNDYSEACLIADLSPKASATLSRRALQGMIRDFWGVKNKSNLFDEIKAIEGMVDPVTWGAIDAVRSIGNIGAHMEKDVNQIIDIDQGEATLLIELVETLLSEWYVQRFDREVRMRAVTDLAEAKKAARNPGASNDPSNAIE